MSNIFATVDFNYLKGEPLNTETFSGNLGSNEDDINLVIFVSQHLPFVKPVSLSDNRAEDCGCFSVTTSCFPSLEEFTGILDEATGILNEALRLKNEKNEKNEVDTNEKYDAETIDKKRKVRVWCHRGH